MRKFILFLLMSLPIVSAVSGCAAGASPAQPAAVLALLQPQDGAVFQLNDLVVVKTGISSQGGVTRVDLLLDGQLVRSDALSLPLKDGAITQAWYALAEGDHTLRIDGYGADGLAASSQEITIHVDPAPAATAAPTAIPTATPTPTFTPETQSPPQEPAQPVPPSAPQPLMPTGTLACAETTGGITLKWSLVSHPDGIQAYEWELSGGGPIKSGATTKTEAVIPSINCFEDYEWKVRAVSGGGLAGPYSTATAFTIN